jgi:hypothetical protein
LRYKNNPGGDEKPSKEKEKKRKRKKTSRPDPTPPISSKPASLDEARTKSTSSCTRTKPGGSELISIILLYMHRGEARSFTYIEWLSEAQLKGLAVR